MKSLLAKRVAVTCGLLVLVVLLWGPLFGRPGAAQEAVGKKVALLVGVNKYDKRGFRDLEYAERDVEELAKVLETAGYEVHLLTGSAAGEKRAELKNIEKAIETVLTGRAKKDLILVALAGHGLQIEVPRSTGKLRAESFFCPADAEQGNPATMLAMGKLFDELDRRGGDHNLVLIDACREDPTRGRGGLDGSKVSLAEGIAALFGCRSGQKTFETKNAGGGHGVFFHFVLEGLRGKAKNARGEITWSSLADYVSEHVPEQAAQLVGDETARQTPNEVRNLPGRSPVLLSLSGSSTVPDPGPKKSGSKKADAKPTFTVLVYRDANGTWEKQEDRTLTTTDEKAARTYVASVNSYAGWRATSDLPDRFAGTKAGQAWDGNGPKIKFCWCPPGKFTMGSARDEDVEDDERQVSVTLSRGFWLGKYEVTQFQWERVARTTLRDQWKKTTDLDAMSTYKIRGEGANFPMYYVNHDEATEFCRHLTDMERKAGRLPDGWEYRLPTEAQWEYASRAGGEGRFSFGDDDADLAAHAWYVKNSDDTQHEVGGKRANAWGFHDMYGNVGEWCRDWYVKELPGGTDPEVTEKATDRAFRGGCWFNDAYSARSGYRGNSSPDLRGNDAFGLRVALVKTGD